MYVSANNIKLKNSINENSTRIDHNYRVGDQITQPLNTKQHLNVRMKLFKRGQMEPLTFKQERSNLE